MIKDTERSLCANLASANNYKQEHLESPEIQSVVQAAKVYYVSGFFMTVSPPSIMSVAKHSLANNKTFCMNLGAEFLMQFFAGVFQEALPYCDIIFGNESEALAYGKQNGLETADIKEIAKHIQAVPMQGEGKSRTVVITQGKDATIVVSGSGETAEFPVDALDASKIVDTNGAGDSFCGGFFSKFLTTRPIAECVEAGHAAARLCVQRSGCVIGTPVAEAAPALPASLERITVDAVAKGLSVTFIDGATRRDAVITKVPKHKRWVHLYVYGEPDEAGMAMKRVGIEKLHAVVEVDV